MLLILSEKTTDLSTVLSTCTETKICTFEEAIKEDLSSYEAFCVIANGKLLKPAFRTMLEKEVESGKKILTVALPSFLNIYSAGPVETIRDRLICVTDRFAPFAIGDLLDDESNLTDQPYWVPSDYTPLFVSKTHILAHRHLSAEKEAILEGSKHGIWMCGENIMMTSFRIADFVKAQFAPRESWKQLIDCICVWLTGVHPTAFPAPVSRFGGAKTIEESVRLGIGWLEHFLLEDGKNGILEGLRHNITHEGDHLTAEAIRTDCSGEAAGAFRFFARIYGEERCLAISDQLEEFVFGPMLIKEGKFAGMLRWTDSAWGVCYPDDAARAMIPALLEQWLFGDKTYSGQMRSALDFLLKITCKDGTPNARFDCLNSSERWSEELTTAEHGLPSAHYCAYYHAALLLGYHCFGDERYLETAKIGLHTLMSLYPETKREQSETEEQCRMIFPLALLYEITKDPADLANLERVTADLQTHSHKSGAFCEWDTGYKASCSRESTGECSVLTENGDPVADLLYSVNWLPMGFAYAFHVTKDAKYKALWDGVVRFFLNAQVHSDAPNANGGWTRAMDLDLMEPYAAPHDVGWGPMASESGWTNSEILMGMMLPDLLKKAGK